MTEKIAEDLSSSIEELINKVLISFFEVYNELGYGLSERIYMTALQMVLEEKGHHVKREVTINVEFRHRRLGYVRADMMVDDLLCVEGKTGSVIPPGSKDQLWNYTNRSGRRAGLLLHFGPSPNFQRMTVRGAR